MRIRGEERSVRRVCLVGVACGSMVVRFGEAFDGNSDGDSNGEFALCAMLVLGMFFEVLCISGVGIVPYSRAVSDMRACCCWYLAATFFSIMTIRRKMSMPMSTNTAMNIDSYPKLS